MFMVRSSDECRIAAIATRGATLVMLGDAGSSKIAVEYLDKILWYDKQGRSRSQPHRGRLCYIPE